MVQKMRHKVVLVFSMRGLCQQVLEHHVFCSARRLVTTGDDWSASLSAPPDVSRQFQTAPSDSHGTSPGQNFNRRAVFCCDEKKDRKYTHGHYVARVLKPFCSPALSKTRLKLD
jgi:hypothetical protein